jgi:hypothetical protein
MSVDGDRLNVRTLDHSIPEVAAPRNSPRPQFGVADVMVLMVGVAAGLAGGTWIAPDVFAVIVGLCTLLGLSAVHMFPPRSHWKKLLWAALVATYVVAVAVALCQPIAR